MLSTGHRHRVTDTLNETHAHLAPRKHTEASKVQLSVTPGGFYCKSFYVLPPHLLPVRFPTCDCPRVDLDRQRGDGDHADILEMVGDLVGGCMYFTAAVEAAVLLL